MKKNSKRTVKPFTNEEGEVRPLTRKEIMAMRPMEEVLPKELVSLIKKRKRGERGAQKAPKKVSVTARYSPEVVKYFKSTGQGWQSRIDDILKGYIKNHPKPHEGKKKSHFDIKTHSHK